MKKAGIGNVIFLEVNVGSTARKNRFSQSGMARTFCPCDERNQTTWNNADLGVGPGWTGSGGPWVKAEESMRHLVAGSVNGERWKSRKIKLPVPAPYPPFFGESNLTPELKEQMESLLSRCCGVSFPNSFEKCKNRRYR